MGIAIYLFEAKSIQSYLARSGRLKDVVNASNYLAKMIDDGDGSDLSKLMKSSGLYEKSDLSGSQKGSDGIHFFRVKGGSFYCWSDNKANLQKLRRCWTLYFQACFPGMAYTDALEEGEDFHKTLSKAFESMTRNFNSPSVLLPFGTAVCQSTPRTGMASVECKRNRGKNEYSDLANVRLRSQDENANDYLYSQTIPEIFYDRIERLSDYFFRYTDNNPQKSRDIALIHLDGNGIGQILMTLKKSLENKSSDEYSKNMRQFSEMLEKITQNSMRSAMKDILNGEPGDFLFRPLVLGGDDVTLLLEPRFAYDFVISFCKSFYKYSKEEIGKNKVLSEALKKANVRPYLSASGGILFNKIAHPFFNSISIVEGLAEKAKQLTKYKPDLNDYTDSEKNELCRLYNSENTDSLNNTMLYSAVGVFRMSSASAISSGELLSNNRHADYENGSVITTGDCVYFVNRDEFEEVMRDRMLTLEDIRDFVSVRERGNSYGTNLSKLIGRIRKMTGYMMNGNSQEQRREELILKKNFPKHESDDDGRGVYSEYSDLLKKAFFAWNHISFGQPDDKNLQIIRKVCGNASHDYMASVNDDILVAYHFINEEHQSAEYLAKKKAGMMTEKESVNE